MKSYLIGIDIGSSNVKTVIFDEKCEVLASETQEYTTIVPKPGWTEYSPDEWWDCAKQTLKRAIQHSKIDVNFIEGIGISSLGCCPVPMDKDGDVLYNGIPWSDQRAQVETNYLKENCREELYKASKNAPTTLNAIPHLMWIKNNEPEIYDKIYKYSEPSGFLVQRFTGEFTLDYSFASSLEFGFDLKMMDWDEALINKIGLDVDKYPRLHDNTEAAGKVTQKAAEETGLVAGIPVFSGGPDFTPGALAAGVIHSGQAYCSMGSGANVLALTDKQDVGSPHLISIIHAKGPQLRMLDGVQGAIGYSLRWFRDQLSGVEIQEAKGKDDSSAFEIMSAKASETQPGAGGIIYIPYLFGKFHPVLNPHAKAVFFGINGMTTRAQMIRAVMEGCCYDMYESLKVSLDIGLQIDEIIVTGGPSKSDLWCQIMADVMNKTIVVVNAPEAAPFGDAILAGVGTGVFESFEDVAEKFITRVKNYEPIEKNHRMYEEMFKVYQGIYSSTIELFEQLDSITSKYS
jgi:xylulokinase